MRRLRQLEEENRRLKVDRGRPGAGHPGAQGRAGKKRLRPAVKRQMVAEVMTTHDLSQRRACGLIGITRRRLQRAPRKTATASCGNGCERTGGAATALGLPDAVSGAPPRGLAGQSQASRAALPRGRTVAAPAAPAQAAEPSARGAGATGGGKSNLGGRFRSRQPD